MKYIKQVILPLLMLVCIATACNSDDDGLPTPADNIYKVCLRASQPATRTAMGEVATGNAGDTQSIRWSDGDQIRVWAYPEGSTTATINAQEFALSSYNATYGSADFTATISKMQQGTYTYHAVYPLPATQSGTTVSYTLPATQSGAYDPALDVMAATTTGNALLARDAEGNRTTELEWEEPTLSFSHLFHLLRIRIPEGKNSLGLAIKRLVITFPEAVVGTCSFDITNPEAMTWTNTSNSITIDLPEGKEIDENNGYVWVYVKPGTLSGEIAFQAYDEAGVPATSISKTVSGKELKASNITPIALTVPASPLAPITYINIEEVANNLGEDWQTMTLSGYNFVVPYTATTTTTKVFTPETGKNYKVAICASASSLQSKSLPLKYESVHTLFDDPITLGSSLTEDGWNKVEKTVPYLLEEDFSGAKSVESNDSYSASSDDKRNMDGILLNNYMSDTGWNASRFKLSAGKSIRIGVRYQSGAWVVGRYCGRLDTPALAKLKANANASIKVTYDMGCYVPKGYRIDDRSNSVTYCVAGSHTQSTTSALKGDNQNDIENNFTKAYTSSYYSNNYGNDSFGATFPTSSFTITGAGNTTRVCWWACTTQESSKVAANCHYYLYLDNIKVSISQ